jgi:hypothetical protein
VVGGVGWFTRQGTARYLPENGESVAATAIADDEVAGPYDRDEAALLGPRRGGGEPALVACRC